jgi:uncharacterized DUF497 family protein
MEFGWDHDKHLRNQREHDDISFESASLVFDDEHCQITLDRVDENGEQRWHVIGAIYPDPGKVLVLLVVHVYREYQDGEDFIRII